MVDHFIIDRKIWLRGEGTDMSSLLRRMDDKQCCLGIYLEACGMPRDMLREISEPAYVLTTLPEETLWLMDTEKYQDINLMTINDNQDLWETQRERKIAEIFAQHGITVEFV